MEIAFVLDEPTLFEKPHLNSNLSARTTIMDPFELEDERKRDEIGSNADEDVSFPLRGSYPSLCGIRPIVVATIIAFALVTAPFALKLSLSRPQEQTQPTSQSQYFYIPDTNDASLCFGSKSIVKNDAILFDDAGRRDFINALRHESCETTGRKTWRFSPVILTSINDCLIAFEFEYGRFFYEYPCYDDVECWAGSSDEYSYSLRWNPEPCPADNDEDMQVQKVEIAEGRFQGRMMTKYNNSLYIVFSDNVSHSNGDASSFFSSSSSCWTFFCLMDGIKITENVCIQIAQQHIQLIPESLFLDAIKGMGYGD